MQLTVGKPHNKELICTEKYFRLRLRKTCRTNATRVYIYIYIYIYTTHMHTCHLHVTWTPASEQTAPVREDPEGSDTLGNVHKRSLFHCNKAVTAPQQGFAFS